MSAFTNTLARVRLRRPALPFISLPSRIQEGLRRLLFIDWTGSRIPSVVSGSSRAIILTFFILEKFLVVRVSRCLAN